MPSGSSRATADLDAPAAEPAGSRSGGTAGPAASDADFGPNQWLVDELYQRYQADPSSVDRAWWNFFADYHPRPADAAAPAPAAPAAAAPAPAVTRPVPAAPAPVVPPAPAATPPPAAAR